MKVGQELNAGTYYIYRGYLSFDTSAVTGTVTGAMVVFMPSTVAPTTHFTPQLYHGTQPSFGGTIEAADWTAATTGPFAGHVNTSYFAAGRPSPAIVATTSINAGGITEFEVRSSREGTQPTGNEYIVIGTADHGTATYKPVLYVGTNGTVMPRPQDGDLRKQSSSSYAACQSATPDVFTYLSDLNVGQAYGPPWELYRSYLSFDCSAIPADATIESATLYWAFADKLVMSYNFDINLYYATQPTWGGTLAAADWGSGTTSTLLRSTTGISLNTYYSASVPTASINRGGITEYELRSSREGTAPTDLEDVVINSASSNDGLPPYLTIVYSAPQAAQVTVPAAATASATAASPTVTGGTGASVSGMNVAQAPASASAPTVKGYYASGAVTRADTSASAPAPSVVLTYEATIAVTGPMTSTASALTPTLGYLNLIAAPRAVGTALRHHIQRFAYRYINRCPR